MVASLRFKLPVLGTMGVSLSAGVLDVTVLAVLRNAYCDDAPETSRCTLCRLLGLSSDLSGEGVAWASRFSCPGKESKIDAMGGGVEAKIELPTSETLLLLLLLLMALLRGLLGDVRERRGRVGVADLADFAERSESLRLGRSGVKVEECGAVVKAAGGADCVTAGGNG
jgi:hypothetical protein